MQQVLDPADSQTVGIGLPDTTRGHPLLIYSPSHDAPVPSTRSLYVCLFRQAGDSVWRTGSVRHENKVHVDINISLHAHVCVIMQSKYYAIEG